MIAINPLTPDMKCGQKNAVLTDLSTRVEGEESALNLAMIGPGDNQLMM